MSPRALNMAMTSLPVLDVGRALLVGVSHVVRGADNRTAASRPCRRKLGHYAPSALSRRRTAAHLPPQLRHWIRAETPAVRGSERGPACCLVFPRPGPGESPDYGKADVILSVGEEARP